MPVFISHSHEDVGSYSTLYLALEGAGVSCFDVDTLIAGLTLAEQLREIIKKCEVCVFLATRRSIQSRWCLAELGAFWGAGKRTIIYVADPDLLETDIPPQFQGNLRTTNARQLVLAVSKALKIASPLPMPTDLLPIEHLKPLAADAAHQYDHIRLACAHTLWAFRPDRAKPILQDQLGDWNDAVKRHASYLLDHYE